MNSADVPSDVDTVLQGRFSQGCVPLLLLFDMVWILVLQGILINVIFNWNSYRLLVEHDTNVTGVRGGEEDSITHPVSPTCPPQAQIPPEQGPLPQGCRDSIHNSRNPGADFLANWLLFYFLSTRCRKKQQTPPVATPASINCSRAAACLLMAPFQ